MNIRQLLTKMIEMDASDLFLTVNSKPRFRIHGSVKEVGEHLVSLKEMNDLKDLMLDDDLRKSIFCAKQGVDFIYVEPDVGRFRVNMFVQRGTPALVARHVKFVIPAFEDLNLPGDLLKKFCDEASGIVLLCGPAGSGKSTAIAAMLEHINETQNKHIVTIEDPIEYLFHHKKSMINQRELDVDVASYPEALKHVTQQSPDIIYIGNVRNVDTMQAAITAAELGTFVVSTFHTINAVQTITRMVNFFPPYLHEEVFMQLSVILKAVISLRLLPLKDGTGRIPAYETMVVTPTIAKMIREGKVYQIQQFIDGGELFGMQSFRKSLVRLVKRGLVAEEDARRVADSRDEFDLEMKGIQKIE